MVMLRAPKKLDFICSGIRYVEEGMPQKKINDFQNCKFYKFYI